MMKLKKVSMKNKELSDDLLQESYQAINKKTRYDLINESLKYNPYNVDSLISLSGFTTNPFLRLEELQTAIAIAKQLLDEGEEDYFSDDYIGIFWGVWETRPYMRASHAHILTLMEVGYYFEAIYLAKQMLVLNENDNMGIRYILMSLYAAIGDKEEADDLIEQFDEDTFTFKFPYAMLLFHIDLKQQAKEEFTKLFADYPFAKGIIMHNKKPSQKDLEDLSIGIPLGRPGEVHSALGDHENLLTSDFKKWFKEEFKQTKKSN